MDGIAGSIYEFCGPLLDGGTLCLDRLKGRVLLIVNTANRCGFTPQYEGLEQLYRMYKDRGLVVLGFPCNQFGEQEPGKGEEILAFCETKYDVTFPMFAKILVNGPDAHPLYRFLKEKKRGILGTRRIKWNFTKFLVDRNGNVVGRYAPSKTPRQLEPAIQRLLNQ